MTVDASKLLPSLSDYIFAHAASFPARTALSSEFGDISYAELADNTRKLALSLQALGVKRGDRVAVISTPRADAYTLFIALNAVGAIWVGINPVYQYEEIAYVIEDAQPVALVFLSEFQGRRYDEDARKLAVQFPCLAHRFCLETDLAGVESLDGLVDRVFAGPAADADLPERDRENVTMIVYTSGSTGQPKGCMLPNKAMVYRAFAQWKQFSVRDFPRVYSPLPLNHVGGIVMVTGATLIAGGTVNFRQKFDPGEVGKVVASGQVNFIVLFPTMYQLIFDHPEFDIGEFVSLECVSFSGGVISRELLGRLQKLGSGIVQTCFGSTETCIGVVFSDPGLDPDILAITVGRPNADDCRVMSEVGRPCAPGEIGEIQVKRDFCMVGYFNRPEATSEAFTADGWLRTGDLVEVLPDGHLRFTARRTEMFKSGGYNIYPREVEIAIEEHPDVVMAAICGVPDALYGEVGYAFVLIRSGKVLSADNIKGWCRQRLANYKRPKTVEILQEMPLFPNGKLDKKSLRELARSRIACQMIS